MSRTMGDVARRYNEEREKCLNSGLSASMSGLEYYPKPWEELDLNDESDLYLISTMLSWDDATSTFTHEGLKKK